MTFLDLLHLSVPRLPGIDEQPPPRCGLAVCLAREVERQEVREFFAATNEHVRELARTMRRVMQEAVNAWLLDQGTACTELSWRNHLTATPLFSKRNGCSQCGKTLLAHPRPWPCPGAVVVALDPQEAA